MPHNQVQVNSLFKTDKQHVKLKGDLWLYGGSARSLIHAVVASTGFAVLARTKRDMNKVTDLLSCLQVEP